MSVNKISSFKDKPSGNKDSIIKPPNTKEKMNLWIDGNKSNTKARVRVYKEGNFQNKEEVMT